MAEQVKDEVGKRTKAEVEVGQEALGDSEGEARTT
jgi:hypothetical protein